MIGIQGGSFDPVHLGHLRSAWELKEGLGLTEVRLIPVRHQPQRAPPCVSVQDRCALLQAAVRGHAGLRVDERELARAGPSFTVDTLISLRAELGNEIPLCLLLGMDAFLNFATWREPQKILTLAHIVVAQRPGWSLPTSGTVADWLRAYQSNTPTALAQYPAGIILTYPVTAIDISSTAIRHLLVNGHSPHFLVPDVVLTIIQERGLYQS